MAPGDSAPSKNPFVRWKQHVDTHIGLALNSLLGIPSMVTKNLNLRSVPGDDDDPGRSTRGSAAPAAPNAAASPSSPSPSDDAHVLAGVDALQLLAWHKFIYYSPYSPLRLQQEQYHHTLPPPVPQDRGLGADPDSFTYVDAFEDLLRASSHRPLLDLSARSYRNLRVQMRYGAGEPAHLFFHRLHRENLLDAYFPKAVAGRDGAGAADTQIQNDSVVQAVATLAERDRHCRTHQDEHEDDYGDGDGDDPSHEWPARRDGRLAGLPRPGSLFSELDRAFRLLSRIMDADVGTPRAPDGESDGRREPSTEDELYDMVRSAYSSAERSLSTLVQAVSGMSAEAPDSSDTRAATTAPDAADGRPGQTVQTTDEHTDVFGNRHRKVVVRRLDADGNEVSRETRYSVRSASLDTERQAPADETAGRHSSDGTEAETHANEESKESKEPKAGWFWK